MRALDKKPERHELDCLRQDITTKISRHDFEMLSVNFNNYKIEADQKIKNADKDIDEFIETMQNEINALKNNLLTSLSKKADYSILDKLNESISKKVDAEILRSNVNQIKTEMMQNIELLKNDINIDRGTKESKIIERLDKNEISGERALDEIVQFKETIRHLQDERKRDIEETADFIKQLMDQQKCEITKDFDKANREIEGLKREIIEKSTLKEVLQIKQTLMSELQNKVDLKEVQQVLNDC